MTVVVCVEGAPVEGRPRTALAVGRRVHEVAFGDAIPVGIRPRAIDRGHERRPGIADGVGVPGPRALEVLPDIHLERRLAVAEDIVGGTHPRRDVVVALHALGAWQQERATELVVGEDAVLSGRGPARGRLVAHGALERQPLARPLVLDVDSRCRGGCCWSAFVPTRCDS